MLRKEKYRNVFNIIIALIILTPLSCSTGILSSWNWLKGKEDVEGNSTVAWDKWKDKQGNPFYINHRTRKAQKEDPNEIDPEHPNKVTKIPYPKSFEDRLKLFYQQIDQPTINDQFTFTLNRSNILKDSYDVVMGSEGANNMKKLLKARFEGGKNADTEENIAKEWLSLLSDEISDPDNGYFRNADDHNYESEINLETKSDSTYFKFIGRVVGIAVYHRIVVNVSFVKPYYRTMLGEPITMDDVKAGDPTYYKYLSQTKKDDLKSYLSLNYASEELDDKNENQLRMMIVHYKYETMISLQMSAFLEGFADLVPLHLLRIFSPDELKLVISGTQTINVWDWRMNTDYGSNLPLKHKIWFWDIVTKYDNDERRRLLQFVTGTSRVPVKGFKNLKPKFKIVLDKKHLEGADTRCPTIQLCFNKIVLPKYSSKEKMEAGLKMALHTENQDITLI